MRYTKELFKSVLASYIIHSLCLLIEALKSLKYIDEARKIEDVKEEFLVKIEKGGRRV